MSVVEGEVCGFFSVREHPNPKFAHKYTVEILVDAVDELHIGDAVLVITDNPQYQQKVSALRGQGETNQPEGTIQK